MEVIHHGGHTGVTGSCHEVVFDSQRSMLVDCGLFQGADARGRDDESHIDFPIDHIAALVLTHVHLDHVGRIPYLIAAGFKGPIYCSPATAKLLPLMLEDALKVGVTRNKRLIERFLLDLRKHIRPIPLEEWKDVGGNVRLRFSPAGHVLGSVFVEFEHAGQRTVFSGDLGSRHQPLLKEPRSPESADLLILESTYGDRNHVGRDRRVEQLHRVLCRTLDNKGVTIIPAFSVGRTQELLYEMNAIFDLMSKDRRCSLLHNVDVIIDSPLAQRFTEIYKTLQPYWDEEAQRVLKIDDSPLVFDNLVDIENHAEHRDTIEYLKSSELPAIVIAASGMCTGGRVVNYLKEFLGDPRTDVVFVGYQAEGTTGRAIQDGDSVKIDGSDYAVRAQTHQLSGYSAHADQSDLLRFVEGMGSRPGKIRLVHGEKHAKRALSQELRKLGYDVE
ncbi:MAG TPA: MBL fold hydrolase [Planctomycetaceae bacterium]|nr:MBL fold hydrolase [Planctomycetaceae bacterium]